MRSRTEMMVDRLRDLQAGTPDIEASAVVSVDRRESARDPVGPPRGWELARCAGDVSTSGGNAKFPPAPPRYADTLGATELRKA